MSNRIRQMRQKSLTPEEIEQLTKMVNYLASGQYSSLNAEDVGGLDQFEDYLNGPSMASILVENAKAQTLQDQFLEARKNETGMGPMISSIKQLDR